MIHVPQRMYFGFNVRVMTSAQIAFNAIKTKWVMTNAAPVKICLLGFSLQKS